VAHGDAGEKKRGTRGGVLKAVLGKILLRTIGVVLFGEGGGKGIGNRD